MFKLLYVFDHQTRLMETDDNGENFWASFVLRQSMLIAT